VKLRFPILTILFILTASAISLAETTIKAEVDKATITTAELLTYKLIIASSEKLIPPPKIPQFKGFIVVSQAESTTTSFQKGGMQSILVYALILLPKQAGKLKIEPAEIALGTRIYSSESFEIEVEKGTDPLPQLPEEKQPPAEKQEPSEEGSLDSDQPQYTL
jgi:hypothetical protein